ncbi:MAG: hypothetical protein JO246_11000 [Frankiaceae bacterium]|nr:hypothetical protein [Frankiaceae bacterium]MBV9872832.1 hypothetical protein [Frankiaceae bacterium]
MASLQELLKWLEQFMHGNLSQHNQPHAPTSAAGAVPHASMPSMSSMPHAPMPAGADHPGLPPGLAGASPQELQAAMQQFTERHPELAPYLHIDGSTDLQSMLSQLQSIPVEALQGFTPSTDLAEPDGFDLGGPMAAEFGVPGFDAEDVSNFNSFADGLGSGGAGELSDLPSVLLDPTAGEFGPLPTSVGAGIGDDYDALAGALSGDLGADYTDLLENVPTVSFEPDLPTVEPIGESFDPATQDFDAGLPAYDEQQFEAPLHGEDFTQVEDYQDQ